VTVDQKVIPSTPLPVSLLSHGSEQRLYECSICAKKFTTFHGVKIHGRSHAERNGYECMICNRRFSTWQRFRGHRRTHTDGLGLECPLCNKRFNNEKGLKVHCSRYHTDGRPFKCSVCKKSFDTEHSLKVHSRLHSEERHHECLVCNETFNTGLGLRLHSRTHTAKIFTSGISQRSEGDSLTQYSNCTLLKLPHECVYCKKRFNILKGLRGHQRFCKSKPPNEVPSVPTTSEHKLPNETPVKWGRHECPFCGRTFAEWRSLSYHVRFHKRVSRKCAVCMKSFRNRKGLRSHAKFHRLSVTDNTSADQVVVHPDFQSVSEVTLDGGSSNKSVLSTNHPSIKNQCTICKMVFRNARGLRTHKIRIHKQEIQQTAVNNSKTPDTAEVNKDNLVQESVMCTVCQKTFSNVHNLKVHCWRLHRDDESQLLSLSSLQEEASEVTDSTVHNDGEDSHVRGQQYHCVDCCKSFVSERGLLVHNGRLHKRDCSVNSAGNTSVHAISDNDNNAKVDSQCHICDKSFDSNRALLRHGARIHKGSNVEEAISSQEPDDDGPLGYYKCKVCNEKYSKVKSFRVHCTIQQHMVQENVVQQSEDNSSDIYKCPVCNRNFFSECSYNRHSLRCHKYLSPVTEDTAEVDAPSLQNSKCNLQCDIPNGNIAESLKIRYSTHRTDDSAVQKQIIGGETPQLGNTQSNSAFECCNKLFLSERGLKIHQGKHHKDYHVSENSVTENRIVHIGDGKETDSYEHVCSVCYKAFLSEKGLAIHHTKSHPERHTGEVVNSEIPLTHQDTELNYNNDTEHKVYECSLCDRSFLSEKGRRLHCRRMHEDVEVFSSNVNDDRPVNPLNVSVPSRTEDGLFECSFCNSVFNNVKGLKIHSTKNHRSDPLHNRSIEAVNGVVNFEEPSGTVCDICDRTFGSEEALTLHFSKNHADSLRSKVIIPSFSIWKNVGSVSENHTKKIYYECSDCRKTFDTEIGYKVHVGKQHLNV